MGGCEAEREVSGGKQDLGFSSHVRTVVLASGLPQNDSGKQKRHSPQPPPQPSACGLVGFLQKMVNCIS